jgi:hypothetical protein
MFCYCDYRVPVEFSYQKRDCSAVLIRKLSSEFRKLSRPRTPPRRLSSPTSTAIVRTFPIKCMKIFIHFGWFVIREIFFILKVKKYIVLHSYTFYLCFLKACCDPVFNETEAGAAIRVFTRSFSVGHSTGVIAAVHFFHFKICLLGGAPVHRFYIRNRILHISFLSYGRVIEIILYWVAFLMLFTRYYHVIDWL